MLTMLLLVSCGYTPDVVPSADYPVASGLSGDVVLFNGNADPGVGHVVVYAADDLPPPHGFGSPIDLATISPDAWGAGGSSGVEGVVSAPWSITGLPDGDYVLSALIDNDGDSNPFLGDFAGGATCGDQLGGYLLSGDSLQVLPVTVEGPSHQDGLTLLVGDPLPFERPAFVLGEQASETMPRQDLEENLFSIGDFEWGLASTAIDHPLLTLNSPQSNDCPTRFTVSTIDADGDGAADPHPLEAAAGFGAVQMWPRVLLRLIADETGAAPDQTYLSEALIDFRDPDDETFPLPRALPFGDDWTPPRHLTPNVPTTTSSLPLIWTGKAVPVQADGTYGDEVSGPDLPAGVWGVIVMNQTGQIWISPNSLSSDELWGGDAIASQAGAIVVAP